MTSSESEKDIQTILDQNIRQLAKNPGDADISCDTAELFVQLNKLDSAIKIVNDCLRINKEDPWLRFRLAGLYLRKGLRSEVSKIIEQLKVENIDTPALRKLRAELLRGTSRKPGAKLLHT
ncbi:MAG: tetratricopeptide repeat protein [Pseudomonadales bacterium]|nr:tetratricopeptide repeat protein [Pseudomonadales bacterium]